MKRWKVYMVVGFSILAIGCASGCADKKDEIEPIKMVAEVQKAEDERKVVEKRIQTIAKEEDHVESENRKEELSEKQEDIEKKPVEKTVDTSPKQVSVSEKRKVIQRRMIQKRYGQILIMKRRKEIFRFQSKVKNHLLKIYIYTNGRSRRRLFTMRQS